MKKKRVVFIVFSPQMWKSLESLYSRLSTEKDFETIIIVVDNEIKWGKTIIGKAINYWKKLYPDAIIYGTNNNCPSIKDLKADFIFRQTPYDLRYPLEYSNSEISKYSKLCYVPYNYNFSKEKHLLIEYSEYFLDNASIIFADSEYIVNYCSKQKIGNRNFKIYNVGSTAFERIQNLNKDSNDRFCLLWIPRWSVDSINNHGTSFFEYYKKLLNYCDYNKDVELIIRPHPFMFEQFIERKILNETDVEKIFDEIDIRDNVFLDKEMDYIYSFSKADALIADYSSLIAEFFLTEKPILLCDSNCDWNDEPYICDLKELLYETFSWNELETELNKLKYGEDILKHKREAIINKYIDNHLSSVSRIIDILRDY